MTDTSDFENMERDGWSNPSIAKGYADGFEMATHLVAEKLAEAVGAKPNVEVPGCPSVERSVVPLLR